MATMFEPVSGARPFGPAVLATCTSLTHLPREKSAYGTSGTGLTGHTQKRFAMAGINADSANVWPLSPQDWSSG